MHILPKEHKIWLWIWLGCNVFALLNIFWGGIYYSFIKGTGHNWAESLLIQLLRWNLLALLITPIINFIEKYPPNNRKPVKTLVTYFGGGFKYSLIHDVSFSILYATLHIGVPYMPFTAGVLLDLIMDSFWSSFVAYIAITSFLQAFTFYKNYQESEENYQRSLLHTSKLETQLVKAQLDALKSQLQPHFIFNALNSISALQLRDLKAAQKMIANLGQFLRLVLKNRDTQEIILTEEIDFLKCYLSIEQVRFQDRLTVRFNIKEEVFYAKVPNLILQPIVENAIKHGVSQKTSFSYINISAKKIDDFLYLEVEDNGKGRIGIESLLQKNELGFGLANTKARLEHLYGAKQKLELNSGVEGGVRVTILLPFQSFSENTLEIISVEHKED